MNQSVNYRVLTLEELEKVFDFEMERLKNSVPDEIERQFASWKANWRKESLEHYLGRGWCMGAWVEKESAESLAGYFLAQPLLFFRNFTQTLWIERVSADSSEIYAELVDIAVKIAREKHMQRVFSNSIHLGEIDQKYQVQKVSENWVEIKTAKDSN